MLYKNKHILSINIPWSICTICNWLCLCPDATIFYSILNRIYSIYKPAARGAHGNSEQKNKTPPTMNWLDWTDFHVLMLLNMNYIADSKTFAMRGLFVWCEKRSNAKSKSKGCWWRASAKQVYLRCRGRNIGWADAISQISVR